MVVDLNKRSVAINGEEIPLRLREFDILHLLITHPGVVYKREDLLKLSGNMNIWETYARWTCI